jgi:CTP:molybdopterin cytidylyltransferase MocA
MKAFTLPTLRIVVLAAGFSARLGKPKALARVHGSTLIERTVGLLAPFARPSKIIVVIPPGAARYRIGSHARSVAFIANPTRMAGLSSSVRRGITQARYSAAVLLLPVDLADLQRRDIARLIARWRGARRSVVARWCRLERERRSSCHAGCTRAPVGWRGTGGCATWCAACRMTPCRW